LHFIPTRRSSDLEPAGCLRVVAGTGVDSAVPRGGFRLEFVICRVGSRRWRRMVFVPGLLHPLVEGGLVPLFFLRPVQAHRAVAEKDRMILVAVHLPLVAAAIGNLVTLPHAAIKGEVV